MRKHHQLNVVWIARKRIKRVTQVVDLIIGKRQAQFSVSGNQRLSTLLQYRNLAERARLGVTEQWLEGCKRPHNRFHHAIVNEAIQCEQALSVITSKPINQKYGHALNAPYGLKPAVMRDVCRLAGPGRYGSETGADHALARGIQNLRINCTRRARLQECGKPILIQRLVGVGIDHVGVERIAQLVAQIQPPNGGSQEFKTGFRQR